ncbi:FkbM family methyltransferase [Limnospira sp. PMC 1042.18]|uniref:FkbM family methyltransferase n=1 Tax=Limnospira sp. PMC 1042.18 TaxID=2981018 RepID=UPI0028E1255A|nr:FkbM family methyltransferase [Limnospira sp. PMC 1042.18]MDT9197658.1 FkbM family methyltransferase [Limnospira sp. PMC 1042.18]
MLSELFHKFGVPFFLSVVHDPNLCISWSQFGEDTLILELISRNKSNLFSNYYVDIGAYHPSRFSNTKLLSMMGWKGMNVDPNPQSVKLFEQERPQDINLNLGVASYEGESEIYCFREGAINTFNGEIAEYFIRHGWEFMGKQKVKVLPLNQLLDTYLPDEIKDSEIGFLDIDCEGLDKDIILNLDIDRYRPYIIAVEAHDFNLMHPLAHEIVQFLIAADYQLAAYTGPTLLFRRST